MTMRKVKGTAIPTYIVDDTVIPPPGAMVHRVLLPKNKSCGDPEIDRMFDESGPVTLEDLKGSDEPIDQFLSEFFNAEER